MRKRAVLSLIAVMIGVTTGRDVVGAEPPLPSLKILRRCLKCETWMTSIAYSPDGKVLATGDWGEEIRLWDASTGKQRLALKGHGKFGTSVAFSPDGKLLASAGHDEAVKVWDAETGDLRFTIELDKYPKTIAFSPDGATLAIGGSTLSLWDVATQKIRITPPAAADVVALAFHRDGKLLATTSGFDDTVYLHDVATGKVISTLSTHSKALNSVRSPKGVYSIVSSPDGKLLASIGEDATIRLWDWSTRREVKKLRGDAVQVYALAFSPDGAWLASTGLDSTIKLWNVKTGEVIATSPKTTFPQNCVTFSPDGSTLCSADISGNVSIWDLTPGARGGSPTLVQPIRPVVLVHQSEVKSVSYSSDGKTLATLSDQFHLWDTASGRLISSVAPPKPQSRSPFLAFSPNQKVLALREEKGAVSLLDVRSRAMTATFQGEEGDFNRVMFSPDAKVLAVRRDQGTIQLWDVESQRRTATLAYGEPGQGYVGGNGMALSADGKTIAAACADKTTKLWDTQTGELKGTIQSNDAWVHSIVFSPDGQRLVTDQMSGIALWNWKTNELLATFETRVSNAAGTAFTVGGAGPIAFTPDGRTLVASCGFGTVRLWDVETINLTSNTYTVHPSDVRALAISPDGKHLATGADDKVVKIWKLISAE